MKLCLTAIMKNIKSLEEKKARILKDETNNRVTSYVSGNDKVDAGYNYDLCRKQVDKLDAEILYLRSVLNKANAVVKVDGTDYTISEALTRLAQLSSKLQYLSGFPTVQLSRRTTYNGIIEYTECLYPIEQVKSETESLREEISSLQMAIDKTNLTYETQI